MNELATHPSRQSVLALADAETANRIAWCIERIAEHGYSPLPAPAVWAGRDDIVARLAADFGIDLLDAAQAVDAAAGEYWNPRVPEDKTVAKRLARQRLMLTRKWIIDSIRNVRSDKQYQWEVNELTGEREKVLFREKYYHGVQASMFALLIQVDSTIMKLDGLEGVDTGEAAATVMEELDGVLDGLETESPGIRRKVTMSLAQTIKIGKVTDLGADGLRSLAAAMDEKDGKKKTVKSKVVDEV